MSDQDLMSMFQRPDEQANYIRLADNAELSTLYVYLVGRYRKEAA